MIDFTCTQKFLVYIKLSQYHCFEYNLVTDAQINYYPITLRIPFGCSILNSICMPVSLIPMMVTRQPVDKAPVAKVQMTVILPLSSITATKDWSPVVSTYYYWQLLISTHFLYIGTSLILQVAMVQTLPIHECIIHECTMYYKKLKAQLVQVNSKPSYTHMTIPRTVWDNCQQNWLFSFIFFKKQNYGPHCVYSQMIWSSTMCIMS